MLRRKQTIEDGDLVIVYERHDRMKAVKVRKGDELQNRYGTFSHDDWLGRPYGSRVVGKKGAGFVYLLSPTPELWTQVLSHRTQILYIADISVVISALEIRPGSVVIESGTGSGSLTTSLARAVSPTGHVHTFEFHEIRANAARDDFEQNGLSSLVTVSIRDIQDKGFPEDLAGKVDAAFLDLPQPWLAVASVAKTVRANGVCCSFSPCIEQVQRTCETFRKFQFVDIRTFEVLLRSYEVHQDYLKQSILSSDPSANANDTTVPSPPHKKQCLVAGGKTSFEDDANAGTQLAMDMDVESTKNGAVMVSGSADESRINHAEEASQKQKKRLRTSKSAAGQQTIIAKPYPETRGHTGFLTFARLWV